MSAPVHPPGAPRPPAALPARYRIKRHLANGGMASVWCAEDTELDRTVAIKVLAERFVGDAEAIRRFKREARAAARVSTHPHVVTVYDVDVLPPDPDDSASSGRAFIVMEYLAGGTVADAIRHDDVGRQEAVRWLREAGSALDYAHRAGIVHRDIKPANFLLDRSRVLHVADFGIARLSSEETITNSDQLFGTAAYLSPEQALGRDATSASDRYALAVVAFELLVGARPFQSPHFSSQARQHIEEPPPPASELNRLIPPAADRVLAAGLAKDPAQRPPSADAFVRALEAALGERRPRYRRVPARRAPGPPIGAPDALTAAARGGRGQPGRARSVAATPDRPGPRQPPPAWVPSSVAAADDHALRGRRRRLAAIGALLATFVIVGAAIAAATGAFSGSSVGHGRDLAADGPAVGAGSAITNPSVTSMTKRQPPSAADLAATGHRQMVAGKYTSAVRTLKQALSAADHGSSTYAYALYNLGRTELLAGHPQAAIPVLRRRLAIPLGTDVVQVTLNQALAAAGEPVAQSTVPETTVSPTTPATTTAPTTTSTAKTTPTSPTGGAGLRPNTDTTSGSSTTPSSSGGAQHPGAAGGAAPGNGDGQGHGTGHRGGAFAPGGPPRGRGGRHRGPHGPGAPGRSGPGAPGPGARGHGGPGARGHGGARARGHGGPDAHSAPRDQGHSAPGDGRSDGQVSGGARLGGQFAAQDL